MYALQCRNKVLASINKHIKHIATDEKTYNNNGCVKSTSQFRKRLSRNSRSLYHRLYIYIYKPRDHDRIKASHTHPRGALQSSIIATRVHRPLSHSSFIDVRALWPRASAARRIYCVRLRDWPTFASARGGAAILSVRISSIDRPELISSPKAKCVYTSTSDRVVL